MGYVTKEMCARAREVTVMPGGTTGSGNGNTVLVSGRLRV